MPTTSSSTTLVLISGANQGIGYQIVKKLATEQPDFHILLGARDLSKGQEAADTLAQLPGKVEAIELDVTSDDSIQKCADHIASTLGRLDVLINNAGIAKFAGRSAGEVTSLGDLRESYSALYATNAIGAACLTEACIPLLRETTKKHPRVIFISSEMGSLANTLDPSFPYYGMNLPQYKSSKAALNQIAAVLAVRLGAADHGGATEEKTKTFKINCCCPGLRKTQFNNHHEKGGDPAEGALEACRLATLEGDAGDNGTFTNLNGAMPW